jgi:hypothetical protein
MKSTQCRVARWFLFKPKIPIWVFLEDLGTENVVTYIFWPFGIVNDQ